MFFFLPLNDIGKKIKERRKELGLSQEDLAKKIGYKSAASINRIEAGSANIPARKFDKFAEALEMTIKELFGIDKEQNNEIKEPAGSMALLSKTKTESEESLKVLKNALESHLFYIDEIKEDKIVIKSEFPIFDDEGEPISESKLIMSLQKLKEFINKTIKDCEERKQSEIKKRVFDMITLNFQRMEDHKRDIENKKRLKNIEPLKD